MKSLLSCILLSVLFISNARSQKIDFSLDTTQLQLQESDAGAADFADIDGDGDQDLIIIGKTPIKTRLYKNDGNGNFSEVENTPFIDVFAGNVAFADVDGDSDFDVLITGNDRRPLPNANLYLNDGKGNFTLQANSSFQPCLGGDVAFAHLNEDSAIDLVGGHLLLESGDKILLE